MATSPPQVQNSAFIRMSKTTKEDYALMRKSREAHMAPSIIRFPTSRVNS